MDEVLVNANLLENNPDSTATALRTTTLQYSIDPMLTRFQIPAWWRNEKGETKRNYRRLAAHYTRGTSIQIAAGPLHETVPTETEWTTLAGNVIDYQRDRLIQIHPQLELFRDELRPVRLIAPALVAFSETEDRINRVLAEGSAAWANEKVGIQVIIPEERLGDPDALARLLDSIPMNPASSYFIWTPWLTEDAVLGDADLLSALVRVVATLSDRGIPVGHLHATYLPIALHGIGMSAVVHHMGWIDKGEPADQPRGGLRSCQTYVPGIHRTARFSRARELGGALSDREYVDMYCECAFCTGSFDAGQHPLDLLLEDQPITFKTGRTQLTPTSRAVGLNTWHFLLSRRLEVEAFSTAPAVDVLSRDIERAAALAGRGDSERLRRLATGLG